LRRALDHARALDWRDQVSLADCPIPACHLADREAVEIQVKGCERKSASGASNPPRLQIVAYGRVLVRDHRVKTEQPFIVPMRPLATGGMCHAQRMDLQAAIAGKITWAEYNRKRGGRSLSL
jgi:hypothetical protein